jgi:DNA-binding SARP family transcriptional activator
LRGIEVDLFAEDFYRGLMRVYHIQGRRAEALAAFKRCCAVLKEVLAVEPSQQTLAVYEAIRQEAVN